MQNLKGDLKLLTTTVYSLPVRERKGIEKASTTINSTLVRKSRRIPNHDEATK